MRLVFGQGLLSDDTEHTFFVASALAAYPNDVDAFQRALSWKLRGWFAALPAGTGMATAKACIQLYLWGGPGAQETWDLKPEAPDGTRGDFKPIDTSLPGFQICEHLPTGCLIVNDV